MFRGRKDKPDEEEKKKLKECMGFFEDFLKPTGFVAGSESMTIADISYVATYSTMAQTKDVYLNLDDYPNAKAWVAKMQTLIPNYEKTCGEGAKVFGEAFRSRTGF